jgi:hypothetical protein
LQAIEVGFPLCIDTGEPGDLLPSVMALLHEAVDKKKMDVRLVERNMARGVVTAAEVEQAVKALPDDSGNAEYVSIESLMNDPQTGSEGQGATHH